MGCLVDLTIPIGNSFDVFCNVLNECGIFNTVIRLKSFRKVAKSGNPASFVYNLLSKHTEKAKDYGKSVVIFHHFDLWAAPAAPKEDYTVVQHNAHDKYEEYLKQIRTAENTGGKLSKCSSNWAYKLLYWIRYSLLFLLCEQFSHELICICIYGNLSTKGFFGDIFTSSYNLYEFVRSFNYLGLDENLLEKKLFAESCPGYKQIQDEFDVLTSDLFDDISDVNEASYRGISNISNITIPFDVEYTNLNLSKVTLICGAEGSGKSTLLKAIAKAWYKQVVKPDSESECTFSTLKQAHIFNLEYYELVSHLVGCGEVYIRNVFASARHNKPSLVMLDGIELIFDNEQLEENKAVPSTISKTLLNELSNLEQGVQFVSCTSGGILMSELSRDFQNVITSIIVLSKEV